MYDAISVGVTGVQFVTMVIWHVPSKVTNSLDNGLIMAYSSDHSLNTMVKTSALMACYIKLEFVLLVATSTDKLTLPVGLMEVQSYAISCFY